MSIIAVVVLAVASIVCDGKPENRGLFGVRLESPGAVDSHRRCFVGVPLKESTEDGIDVQCTWGCLPGRGGTVKVEAVLYKKEGVASWNREVEETLAKIVTQCGEPDFKWVNDKTGTRKEIWWYRDSYLLVLDLRTKDTISCLHLASRHPEAMAGFSAELMNYDALLDDADYALLRKPEQIAAWDATKVDFPTQVVEKVDAYIVKKRAELQKK